MYFLGRTSGAASAFESFQVEVPVGDTPSVVLAVRSDNGRAVFGEDFENLCRKRGIKQKLTRADSSMYNVVAERALALINGTSIAAHIQVSVLYPGALVYSLL